MKKNIKKLLSFVLCILLAFTAIPLTNYLDYIGEHGHEGCTEDHDHDHNKIFFERLFSDFFPSAHAATPHRTYNNTAGCRTHWWCSWGCAACEYDTYSHSYNGAGYCTSCGAFGGHTHYFQEFNQSGHPHSIYAICSGCGYSYINGYVADANCLSCYPCSTHSWKQGSISSNGNGSHDVAYYCTRCLTRTASTATCSLAASGVTATGGGTHTLNNRCACGYTTSSVQACSGGRATTTAPANCSTCGKPYGSPDPCANGHNFYAYYCVAEHPHANYNYCLNCRYQQFDGTYRYKSNCKLCNPDLVCLHTAETFTQSEHPHRVICRGCCEAIATSSYLSSCLTCNPSGGSGSTGILSIWASTSLTSVSDSGVLSIEYAKVINDSFTFGANVPNGDTLKSLTCTGPGGYYPGNSVNITNANLGTFTITATTGKGATRTISITVKTQSAAIGDIRFRTVGMNIKKITNLEGYLKNVASYITMQGASIIPQSEFAKIASLIGKYDGKTYTINGSLVIEVYNVKTGKVLGTYDVLAEYGALTAAFSWGSSTVSDFKTMQNTSLSYQAPKQINANATYCSQDRRTVFGTLTAQQIGAPQFIFPYETYSTVFSSGMVSVPSKWEYHGAQWTYNPQGSGFIDGSAVGQTSIAVTFTTTTPACAYYFYWKETTGSITVSAVDSATGAGIGNATVSLGGSSGGNGTTFNNLLFGTYTASASAPGYYSGSGSATISSANKNAGITIALTRIPTHGNLTVTVRNSVTDAVIPNAAVTCTGIRQTTNSAGVTTFSDILAGTYAVTASASDYDPATVNASIVAGTGSAATIYLTPSVTLGINPIIEGTGQFRKGSTVLVSAEFSADRSVYPTHPASIAFTATYKRTSGSGYVNTTITSQNKDVIVPAGETNLVWFEMTLPASGYYSDQVTLNFTISPPDGMSGTPYSSSTTANVITPIARSSPETKFEKAAPPSFLRLNRKNRANPTVTWRVWEWAGGAFVRNAYSASLTTAASLSPDETAGYAAYNSGTGLWTTRSGYGLNTLLTVSAPNISGMIAGTAKADVFYPEFNYSTAATSSNNLLLDSTYSDAGSVRFKFTYPVDDLSLSKHKLHKTPVWYPDGEYTVGYTVFDVWTPGGELTATDYAIIKIDGSMYDDSYAKPIKK